jgi:hypothetical protein
VLRFLFGMKLLAKRSVTSPTEPVPVG